MPLYRGDNSDTLCEKILGLEMYPVSKRQISCMQYITKPMIKEMINVYEAVAAILALG